MAFLNRVGSILKQSVSKQIGSQISASSPSLYQALRCMSTSKVFVGGLSYQIDDHSLREEFSRYGEVLEARVIIDREMQRSRGFGFVTFASSEEASSAIQALDGQDLQGRRVKVNYAAERAPRFNTGGGGGGYGGNFGGGGGGYGGNYGGGGGGYGGNYGGGGGYSGGNYGGGGGYAGGQSGGYGGAPAQQFGGGDGGFSNNGPGVATGAGDSYFGGGAAGGNVTAETGFASSGFENGSGLGGSDQFGSSNAGENGPLEETFKDDDDSDNFAKRA